MAPTKCFALGERYFSWEFPWFAAWDLAFHSSVLALVDVDFAKQQLELMLRENYLHPN